MRKPTENRDKRDCRRMSQPKPASKASDTARGLTVIGGFLRFSFGVQGMGYAGVIENIDRKTLSLSHTFSMRVRARARTRVHLVGFLPAGNCKGAFVMIVQCYDCRFFSTLDDGVGANSLMQADPDKCLQGHCRRNPPAVGHFRGEDEDLDYDYGQWPLVLSCDWCGAFEACQRGLEHDATPTRHVGPRGDGTPETYAPTAQTGCCDVGERGAMVPSGA
jgi:hypothetical protein